MAERDALFQKIRHPSHALMERPVSPVDPPTVGMWAGQSKEIPAPPEPAMVLTSLASPSTLMPAQPKHTLGPEPIEEIMSNVLLTEAELDQDAKIIKKEFKKFDKDKSGGLDKRETKVFLKKVGCPVDDDFEDLFARFDVNHSGTLDAEQFEHLRNYATARAMFHTYDRDKNGSLDMGETKKLLKKLNRSTASVETVFASVDKDMDGGISVGEFMTLYTAATRIHIHIDEPALPPVRPPQSSASKQSPSSSGPSPNRKRSPGSSTGRISARGRGRPGGQRGRGSQRGRSRGRPSSNMVATPEPERPRCTKGRPMVISETQYMNGDVSLGYTCDFCSNRSAQGHLGGSMRRWHCDCCQADICFDCVVRRCYLPLVSSRDPLLAFTPDLCDIAGYVWHAVTVL